MTPEGIAVVRESFQADKGPGGAVDFGPELGKTPASALVGQGFPGAPAPSGLIKQSAQRLFLEPLPLPPRPLGIMTLAASRTQWTYQLRREIRRGLWSRRRRPPIDATTQVGARL